ncbi:MAG: metal ABC transporter ATP-binding protein [Ilumatobacteraceae bacterium]
MIPKSQPAGADVGADLGEGRAVVATDLRLAHPGRVVLDGARLTVEVGQGVAVIGPNGSGKSTLLRALAGLHPPAAGSLGVAAWASPAGVAFVLQNTVVEASLPLTVREAVAMARYRRLGMFRRFAADDRAAVARSLDRLDVADLASRQLSELSGGQRQRVLVAQGLAQEAELLLLDEPFTGVDVVSRERIIEALAEERRRGVTVVVSTHELADAWRADQVVLVAERRVRCGPPAEVLTDEVLAEAYGARVVHLADGGVLVDDPHHHDAHHHEPRATDPRRLDTHQHDAPHP